MQPIDDPLKTIFTFWEPKGSVVPYVRLCMETWAKKLPDYHVIILDHASLPNYIGEDTFDMGLFRQLSLPQQKDAVLAAVLQRHGGIFMDADTIAVADVAPLVQKLERTEVVMFGMHLAVVAARPNARILSVWLERLREKLEVLRSNPNVERRWDFAGNSVLTEVMHGLMSEVPLGGATLPRLLHGTTEAFRRVLPASAHQMERLERTFVDKRRGLFYRTVLGKYLTSLDRERYGFMPELVFERTRDLSATDSYLEFWFSRDPDLREAFVGEQMLIGLHHSWTPEWYARLSEEEVLRDDCLLSRTLRSVLGRGRPPENTPICSERPRRVD